MKGETANETMAAIYGPDTASMAFIRDSLSGDSAAVS